MAHAVLIFLPRAVANNYWIRMFGYMHIVRVFEFFIYYLKVMFARARPI